MNDSETDRTTAFTEMVARYERCGWSITTINHAQERAFVRTDILDSAASAVISPDRVPACRKLWIDRQGETQETTVPC